MAEKPLRPRSLKYASRAVGLTEDAASEVFRIINSGSDLPTNYKTALKYKGEALLVGRPSDAVMIFMCGTSGAGKSTTINILFDDENLCPVSSTESKTRDPSMVFKQLTVSDEGHHVTGKLGFVDIPGFFDTSGNDVENLASVLKFIELREELQSREELVKCGFPKSYTPRVKVYPNVILLMVKVDNRMDGRASIFYKSVRILKETGIFDGQRPNLIIVLSHATCMGFKKEAFVQKLEEYTRIIRKRLRKILGQIEVDVVPVENNGHDFSLEKQGDFYQLPNGELSHYNLFQAMQKLFDRNKDRMGKLFVGQYFGTECPEKNGAAEKVTNIMQLDTNVMKRAHDIILSVNNIFVPLFNFQSFGNGYCPVTEEVKKKVSVVTQVGLPTTLNLKTVQIGNAKLLIPDFVAADIQTISRFDRLTFFNKREYEIEKQNGYTMKRGLKLRVQISSNGRWVEGEERFSPMVSISMVIEIRVATFKLPIENKELLIHPKIMKALQKLPDTYSSTTANEYMSFFKKRGTHIISEQAVGGFIQLEFKLPKSCLSTEKLVEIERQVAHAFKQNSGVCQIDGKKLMLILKSFGATSEQLQIDGGGALISKTLESFDESEIEQWLLRLPNDPIELNNSIKLYPYYELLNDHRRRASLYEATEEYLNGTIAERMNSPKLSTRKLNPIECIKPNAASQPAQSAFKSKQKLPFLHTKFRPDCNIKEKAPLVKSKCTVRKQVSEEAVRNAKKKKFKCVIL